MIRRDVERLRLLTNFHHLNGFVLCNFENIQQLRPRLLVLHELDDFVDATVVCADVEDFKLLISQLIAESEKNYIFK